MLLAWPTDAYLLISQPQSSSTSARLQLAAMAGLKSTQTYPCGCAFNTHEASQLRCGKTSRGFPKNSTFVALKRHTDVCNLHPRTVGAWADSATTIYQQHLVPTPTNFRGLANSSRPAVVLLRGALGSAHALCERTRLENTRTRPAAATRHRRSASCGRNCVPRRMTRRCSEIRRLRGVRRRLARSRRARRQSARRS